MRAESGSRYSRTGPLGAAAFQDGDRRVFVNVITLDALSIEAAERDHNKKNGNTGSNGNTLHVCHNVLTAKHVTFPCDVTIASHGAIALSRRPVHLAPRKDVNMQVIHGLTSVGALINDKPEAARGLLAPQLCGHREQLCDE
jgi:hypothetical protein